MKPTGMQLLHPINLLIKKVYVQDLELSLDAFYLYDTRLLLVSYYYKFKLLWNGSDSDVL
jgi:hypothetical protein